MKLLQLVRWTLRVCLLLLITGAMALGAGILYLKTIAPTYQRQLAWTLIYPHLNTVFRISGQGYLSYELTPELRETQVRLEILEAHVMRLRRALAERGATDLYDGPATWRASNVTATSALLRGFVGADPTDFQLLLNGRVVHAGRGSGTLEHLVSGLALGATYRVELVAGTTSGGVITFHTRAPQAPTVESVVGTFASASLAVLQGEVNAHGMPTQYWFEFGPSRDDLSRRTPSLAVGPARTAFYRDDFDLGLGRVEEQNGRSTLQADPRGGNFYRAHMPSAFSLQGLDNHHDAVELFPSFMVISPASRAGLGAGHIDLRDAIIDLDVNVDEFQRNGTKLAFAVQSSKPDGRIANWAFTAVDLSQGQAGWQRRSFQLASDARRWTYMGDNDHQLGSPTSYKYVPLNEILGRNNDNFYIGAFFADERNPPSGMIDFDNVSIRYRNRSLMADARLISFPEGPADPMLLTDGGAAASGWVGKWPAEFVWELTDLTVVNDVRVHQNFERPATEIEIAVSENGTDFVPILSTRLDFEPPFPMTGTRFDPRYHGFAVASPDVTAKFVRLRILSGVSEFAGLRQVSIYSDQVSPLPDELPGFVNADVEWRPGADVFYRLVATNALGHSFGETMKLSLPKVDQPWIGNVAVVPDHRCGVRVEGRISPLGNGGTYQVVYEAAGVQGRSKKRPTGTQVTPRDVSVHFCDVESTDALRWRLEVETQLGRAAKELPAAP